MALAVSTVTISYLFLVDPDSKYQSLPGWTRLLANMFTGTISHTVTNFNSYISCVSIKVQGESSEFPGVKGEVQGGGGRTAGATLEDLCDHCS